MWIELAAAGYLVGRYIYHRLTDDPDMVTKHVSFKVPAADSGDVVPLIFGRCRVHNPILAWTSKPTFTAGTAFGAGYRCNLFYILGISADTVGGGTHRIYNMWFGDNKFTWFGTQAGYGTNQTGDGGFESELLVRKIMNDGEEIGGYLEFLNGKPTQQLVDGTGTPTCYTGTYMMNLNNNGCQPHLTSSMVTPAEKLPGYRGYLSVLAHFSHAYPGEDQGYQWLLGRGSTAPNYSFEVGSYPVSDGLNIIGQDMNPVSVIKELIIKYFGKLGLGASAIDTDSFVTAGTKLIAESHGYSRCMDEGKSAEEWIMEILKQIDAALYEDPKTGKLKIKLIRNDYDPLTIPVLDKNNVSKIESFAAGGWTGVINKIKLVYLNSADDFREASVTVQNMADAVGQDGVVREQVVRMLGITNEWLAWRVAERELHARSRPLMKARITMDRTKLSLNQGDAVRLVWNDPDLNVIFRVANVSHGVINDGKVAIDLIQDYFYTVRNSAPESGGLGGFGDINLRTYVPSLKRIEL